MYKIEELRSKSESELLVLISEVKGKLLSLRFENATGQLTESHLIKATRKDIARIFTVLKEKQKGISLSKYIEQDKANSKRKIFRKDKSKIEETKAKVEEIKKPIKEISLKTVENDKRIKELNLDEQKAPVKDLKIELENKKVEVAKKAKSTTIKQEVSTSTSKVETKVEKALEITAKEEIKKEITAEKHLKVVDKDQTVIFDKETMKLNFAKLTIKELKEELTVREIKFKSNLKKQDLIDLLAENLEEENK